VIRSLIDVPGSVQPFAALQVYLLNTAFEPTIAAYVAPSITVERSVRTDASKKPKSHTLEEQPDEVVKVSDPNRVKKQQKSQKNRQSSRRSTLAKKCFRAKIGRLYSSM
jgi:hypothetical protein